jgi:hypothetical protein
MSDLPRVAVEQRRLRGLGALLLAAIVVGCGLTQHTFEPSPTPTPIPAQPDTTGLPFDRASAEGYVLDEEGRPIYPAFVAPENGGAEIALGTTPDGFYSLDGYFLRPGTYKLLVKADGYVEQRVEVDLPGQMRKRIDFTLIRRP